MVFLPSLLPIPVPLPHVYPIIIQTVLILIYSRFSMPPNSHDPLTGYQHGRLLEEGCIQVTKTTLEKEDWRRSVGSSDDDGEVENEEDGGRESGKEHENMHLQWTWTELKR